MSEATSLNVSISGGGKSKRFVKAITNDDLIEWIQRQELDVDTVNKLIQMSKKCPSHALSVFKKNFALMVIRARAEINRELDIEINSQEKVKENEKKCCEEIGENSTETIQEISFEESGQSNTEEGGKDQG